MENYDEILGRRIGLEKGPELPSLDNIAGACSGHMRNCIIARIVRKETTWTLVVSETSSAIRATIFSFDAASDGKDGACRGYFLCRRLNKPQKDSIRACKRR